VSRREEVEAGLESVRARIARACAEAGRVAEDVHLVVVTKTFPAGDVRLLAELGVTDVAENKQQELAAKAGELAPEDLRLTWHFVGHIQSNKAGSIAQHADVVHSLDRRKLVGAMGRRAHEHGRRLDVLLQVSLDPPGADHRSGAPPADLAELAGAVLASESLSLRGLMAVAPLGEDPAAAFERLAVIRDDFVAQHPSATVLSAGMSGDLEAAIHAGATHVRVGSAVLGSRGPVH
jgi:pyridoxal phosphate enzyme (YggS family)